MDSDGGLYQQHQQRPSSGGGGRASLNGTQGSSGSSKIVTSLIIEFSPVYGPRVKRTVPGTNSLPDDKKEWLVQFITKDLLHMQRHADESAAKAKTSATTPQGRASVNITAQQQQTKDAQHHSPARGTSAGISITPRSTHSDNDAGTSPVPGGEAEHNRVDEHQFVKVLCLDQLGVAVVVIFFSVEQEIPVQNGPPKYQALMYAVAIALEYFSAVRLKVALPTIRDRLFFAHQEILYQDADEINIEKSWHDKLLEIIPQIDFWIVEMVNRDQLDLSQTIFRRAAWVPAQLCAVLTAAMSHHRCILRSDNEYNVVEWLNTVAWFMQDDRLLFSSTRCFENRIVPDLYLQGTTQAVEDIIPQLHLFRHAAVVIDVDKPLEAPAHCFPAGTHILFDERRRKIFEGQLPAGEIQHSKSRPPALKNSVVIAAIVTRIHAILPPKASPHSGAGPASSAHHHNNGALGGPHSLGMGLVSNNSLTNLAAPLSTEAAHRTPPLQHLIVMHATDNTMDISLEKFRCVASAIEQWRKQMSLKALSFYVSEIELKRDAPMNAHQLMRLANEDHLVLQVAVDYVSQVQEARERRVQAVLKETFSF